MKPLIYLATPYSSVSPLVREARFLQACNLAKGLMRAGHLVVSPIAHSHPIAYSTKPFLPGDALYWHDWNMRLLAACDELWVGMLDGWMASQGVAGELEEATKRGMPIRYVTPDGKVGEEP